MGKTFQDLLNNGQARVLGIVSPVPMGNWLSTTQYQKLNLVRHNTATYIARTSNQNIEPGVADNWATYWMLICIDGGQVSPDGEYPEMSVGSVMHALLWGNKSYDGSSTQTITAADLGLADVYKPQGSVTFANLPATPNESNYGYVWNISDDFTTDSRFLEGAGKACPAGTNVGVIEQDSAYYYDIFGAFVDLSNYATVEALNAEITRAKAAEQANAIAASKAQSTANSKYTKPSSGIPKSDLAQSVQDSLDKADSALQSAPVTSVNGETGAVSLSAADVGAATETQVNSVSMVPYGGQATTLSALASGGVYNITANGFLRISYQTTAADNFIGMKQVSSSGADMWGFLANGQKSYGSGYPFIYMPVAKGDHIKVDFGASVKIIQVQLIKVKTV